VTVYVCNFTQQPQSYALSFAGTSGPGCTVAGPTSFTITSQNTNNVIGPVAPGYCQPETVKVVKPNGMGNGDVSCFSMTATNTASNISRVTNGSFTANESVCPILKSQVLTSVGVGVSVAHTFQLTNTSFVAQNVNVEVEAIGVDQPILVGGRHRELEWPAAGFPWFTSYALAPGESTLVNVDAQFTELTPFVPYDILLSADIDGNGSPDAKVAAGMINSEAPLTDLEVPKERPPSTVDLIGAWPNPFHRLLTVELALPKAGRFSSSCTTSEGDACGAWCARTSRPGAACACSTRPDCRVGSTCCALKPRYGANAAGRVARPVTKRTRSERRRCGRTGRI
jgi:hypothetical protein